MVNPHGKKFYYMTNMPSKKNIFTIHNKDARNICDIFDGEIIDVTITSPPYFDMKDYGNKKQIGYGQTYDCLLYTSRCV